ncbi:hypothetical protein HBI25_092760 [Parastagonospora nodorum]|nr:hypothetical protein HBH51_062010 [Parastagonospora nodorum]KAH3999200.1 hypothetical protein HBI10_118650 [Parastagonospora nodorum]KAH4025187.1 hypothetical protein HBI13_078540 [Parastagonospora nodorum]KAH4032539.1 hypothetical protein HBI09_120180 [Parastagonospora nodorum]KAH4170961.1 hypothetical protein HBH43_105720 [Parastagonospora nodorum]
MPTQHPVPVPQGQGILTTLDKGPGPERVYTLIRVLEVSTGGVDYLVCDNENGGLWHGHFDGPKAYFYMRNNQDSFPIHGFKVGNRGMFPTCPDVMFPLFDPTKMKEYVPGIGGPPVQNTDKLRLKWPDVFGALRAERRDHTCRDTFAKELAVNVHLAVCPQPYLALYKGVVVKDMHGGPRVTCIVYDKHTTTLWEFVKVYELLQPVHFDRITTGIREGIKALHKKNVVHRQVMAKNVYLSYVVQMPLVYIIEVKLGNFEKAEHCVSGQELEFLQGKRHDDSRQVLLEEWLRYVLGSSGRMLTDRNNATNTKIQEGVLGGKQLEEVEKFLNAQLNQFGPWNNTASDTGMWVTGAQTCV